MPTASEVQAFDYLVPQTATAFHASKHSDSVLDVGSTRPWEPNTEIAFAPNLLVRLSMETSDSRTRKLFAKNVFKTILF